MIRSTLLTDRSDVVQGFSGDAWDLGTGASDAHWAAAVESVGAPGLPVAIASQVHGAAVLRVDAGGMAGEGDALVTKEEGLLLAVRVADCVPIVAVGPSSVAAIHAGWRGLAAGVIGAAVEAMGGASAAVVGPCICGVCYQVGREVLDGIAPRVPLQNFAVERGGHLYANLKEAARWQLASAGIDRVDVLDACTQCSPGYHSYRRDGDKAGRQVGMVGRLCG